MNYTYSRTINLNAKQSIIVGIIFALIGVGLLIGAFVSANSRNEKSKTYIDITAVVVDYERKRDSDGDVLYAPVVEYTVDGKTYRKTSTTYTSSEPSRGSDVKLKYNPNNPEEVIWVHDFGNIILFIMGPVFMVVGILISVMSAKKMKNEESLIVQGETNQIDTSVSQNTNNNIQNNINM